MDALKVYKYTLPLTSGKMREGLLVHLKGWAEIAPLPLYSKETLQEVLAQLKKPKPPLFPSVAFGLESAEAACLKPFSVPIAAFLAGTKEQILAQAQTALTQGCRTAKLKLKGLSLQDALFLIQFLHEKFCLRIDGNQSFTLEEALTFCKQLPANSFEYFEEPLKHPHELKNFPYPVAIDESIEEVSLKQIPNLKALIFKPTIRGGKEAILRYKQLAQEHACDLVLSSAFESGVGLFHIASLIQRFHLPLSAVGIGTYFFLKEDVLKTPLEIAKGKLYFPSVLEIKEEYHALPY